MELTLTNELNEYLQKIQDEADEMEDRIERQLKAASGIKEEWKNTDTLRWVREMNQIRHQAREKVLFDKSALN